MLGITYDTGKKKKNNFPIKMAFTIWSGIFGFSWAKNLPFKMTFTICRTWKFRLPIDEVLQEMGISLPSI